jgi:hypothetical protein
LTEREAPPKSVCAKRASPFPLCGFPQAACAILPTIEMQGGFSIVRLCTNHESISGLPTSSAQESNPAERIQNRSTPRYRYIGITECLYPSQLWLEEAKSAFHRFTPDFYDQNTLEWGRFAAIKCYKSINSKKRGKMPIPSG